MSQRIKFIISFYIFFIFTGSGLVSAEIKKSEVPFAEKKIRLSWEEVESAVSYRVMIKDLKDRIIINNDSDTNHIVLEISPGKYKIRIGSINKFSKVSGWSDWADISIEDEKQKLAEKEKQKQKLAEKEKQKLAEKEKEKQRLAEKEKEKIVSKADLFNLGLKIGLGMSYFYILPDWDEYYRNSYKACTIDIAYSFRYIDFPVLLRFLKYTGLDIDSSYVKFDCKNAFNRIESNITHIDTGADIIISTAFDFPLNFALKGGGGITYTSQEYQKYDINGDPLEKGSSGSADFFYKAGFSIEYRFYSCFFLEACADYYSINYLVNEFQYLRFTCLMGIRL